MNRLIRVRGNKVTFECTQKEKDSWFQEGLQILADKHFGTQKVVVVPANSPIGKLAKKNVKTKFEASEEFVVECISAAFNKRFEEFLESYKDSYKAEKKSKRKK